MTSPTLITPDDSASGDRLMAVKEGARQRVRAPGRPAHADLGAVLHSLTFYCGLYATDRPDHFGMDADAHKNMCFELDTQNEIAMVEEAMAVQAALVEALRKTLTELSFCADQLASRGVRCHPNDCVSVAQQLARAALAAVSK